MARQLQVAENEAKIKEANIKKFPKVIANALYQYNFEIDKITIPAGPDGIVYDREKEQYRTEKVNFVLPELPDCKGIGQKTKKGTVIFLMTCPL